MRASLGGAMLLVAVLPAGLPTAVSAQTPASVSFRTDVLPLLREHCVSCHGPTQQMNGLRLDRRSAALTGGTITVLIPGNSAASRLYLKLVGTQYGQQMPPSGRLSDHEIALVKKWIDQGAEWAGRPCRRGGGSTTRPIGDPVDGRPAARRPRALR